ncbi:hypothetical protein HYT51_02255 [Candidatus Woesearchaeota archaeon]|nr:hypothetical protein [Candidatus Woesearchaeota archaeon]
MVNFNLKEAGLIVGIAILFAFFVFFSIEAFYPQPKYEDYCKDNYRYQPKLVTEPYEQQIQRCGDIYSSPEVQNCYQQKGNPTFKYDNSTKCDIFDTCDLCSILFEGNSDNYQRNIFIISAIVGIAAILFGLYFSVSFMSGGFLFGGILTLAAGTIRYFASGHVDRYLRMAVLFVELVILIWIGYRKVVKKEKNHK